MSAGALADDHAGLREACKDESSGHVDKRFESEDNDKDGYLDEDESNSPWHQGDIDGPYRDDDPGNL